MERRFNLRREECRRIKKKGRSLKKSRCLAPRREINGGTWLERQGLPQTSRNQKPQPRLVTQQKSESASATPTTVTTHLQNCLEPMHRQNPAYPPPLTLIWMTLTPHPFSTSLKRTCHSSLLLSAFTLTHSAVPILRAY